METCYTVKSKISNGQIFSLFLLFAGDSCDHWMHYSDATKTRSGWAKELLNEFKSNVELLKQAVKDQVIDSPPKSPPAVSPQNLPTGILFTSLILYFHEIWKLWKKKDCPFQCFHHYSFLQARNRYRKEHLGLPLYLPNNQRANWCLVLLWLDLQISIYIRYISLS